MKFFLFCLIGFWIPQMVHAQPDHAAWTQLLQRHVDSNGNVDYKGFIRDKKYLETYLEVLSSNPPASHWSAAEKMAFWINAYNAFTVKLIVNHYPVESIKDLNPMIAIPTINTVWQEEFFSIGGKKMSLDEIEHSILRKQFSEPRIHFAINCASVSCPPLRREAYTGKKLNDQLREQAEEFINDPKHNAIKPEAVEVSQLFNWFAGDFTRKGTLIDFLNTYSKIRIKSNAPVRFRDYDWRLNEQ